ncbi:MAG: FAD-dependent oxidoreductase, partial [Gemmatimonadota bacterium]
MNTAAIPTNRKRTVAIVGAGVAGLSAARHLRQHGLAVRVFEKSRGLGGRSATRRANGLSFDHGAQYFTVRDPRMAEVVTSLEERGGVARWEPRVVRLNADGSWSGATDSERYVGVPGMSALGAALAGDTPVLTGTRIESIRPTGDGEWKLASAEGPLVETYAAVIVSCPPAQSADLLEGVAPALADACREVRMLPCWAAMVAFEETLDVGFDAAFIEDRTLAWAARESSKPGRRGLPECWTLHASPPWSEERLEDDRDVLGESLLNRFLDLTGSAPVSAIHLTAHRWRFARSADPRRLDPVVDPGAPIALAGD